MNAAAVIAERLTYSRLYGLSEPRRKVRAKTVRGPALELDTGKDATAYHFNFKAYPSTTGQRHRGYMRVFRPNRPDVPLQDLDCEVDCTCPDYRYRYAWSNKQRGSGRIGVTSFNKAINRAPRVTNPANRPGLCKHLLALQKYVHGHYATYTNHDDPADRRLDRLVTALNRQVVHLDQRPRQALPGKSTRSPRPATKPPGEEPNQPVSRPRVNPRNPATGDVEDAVVMGVSTLDILQEFDAGTKSAAADNLLDVVKEIRELLTQLVQNTGPEIDSADDTSAEDADDKSDVPDDAVELDPRTGEPAMTAKPDTDDDTATT